MTTQKPIHLALQGGGAHGAFTWGVLDALLEDGRLKIEAISGTSAGALNALAMAPHYSAGNIDDAREGLCRLWKAMSEKGVFSPYNYSGTSPLFHQWGSLMSWSQSFFGGSPYQNPLFNTNFLEDILKEQIDFDQLSNDCSGLRLFVSATNVLTNRLRIFSNSELSVNVLLASSCLPKVHKAVEIDGDYFWDGGFMGNPVLEPLAKDGGANDIMIVQVNPLHINTVPTSPMDIAERMETIGFNATLSREIRHVAQMERLVETGQVDSTAVYGKYMHLLHNEECMASYSAFTKYDMSWEFLTTLKALGRETAQQWLDENYTSIGVENTLCLEEWEPTYQQPVCNIN
ncbi:patatin-like phospholipase family protein [Eionea flava]